MSCSCFVRNCFENLFTLAVKVHLLRLRFSFTLSGTKEINLHCRCDELRSCRQWNSNPINLASYLYLYSYWFPCGQCAKTFFRFSVRVNHKMTLLGIIHIERLRLWCSRRGLIPFISMVQLTPNHEYRSRRRPVWMHSLGTGWRWKHES